MNLFMPVYGNLVATFRERAPHSIYHAVCLYQYLLVIGCFLPKLVGLNFGSTCKCKCPAFALTGNVGKDF